MRIEEKIENKIKKFKKKYEKKLQIVEKDVKLSDIEKQKVYNKLKKQIRKEKAKNLRHKDFKEKLIDFSEYVAGDVLFNRFIGEAGFVVVAVGFLGLLNYFGNISLSVFLGATPVGLLAMYNSYLNEPNTEGETFLDKIGEEDFEYRIAVNDFLDSMYKKIPDIKPKNLEPQGR